MNMNKIWMPLLTIFVFVPAAIFLATYLWNVVLTSAVTWANPVGFWQMFGMMVLFWIIYPGKKPTIKSTDDK